MPKKTAKEQSQEKLGASRRSFLKKAAVGAAGAAVAAVPTIHVAQAPTTLRFQSTWPTKMPWMNCHHWVRIEESRPMFLRTASSVSGDTRAQFTGNIEEAVFPVTQQQKAPRLANSDLAAQLGTN